MSRFSGLWKGFSNGAFGHSFLKGRDSWLKSQAKLPTPNVPQGVFGALTNRPVNSAGQPGMAALPQSTISPISRGENAMSRLGQFARASAPVAAAAGIAGGLGDSNTALYSAALAGGVQLARRAKGRPAGPFDGRAVSDAARLGADPAAIQYVQARGAPVSTNGRANPAYASRDVGHPSLAPMRETLEQFSGFEGSNTGGPRFPVPSPDMALYWQRGGRSPGGMVPRDTVYKKNPILPDPNPDSRALLNSVMQPGRPAPSLLGDAALSVAAPSLVAGGGAAVDKGKDMVRDIAIQDIQKNGLPPEAAGRLLQPENLKAVLKAFGSQNPEQRKATLAQLKDGASKMTPADKAAVQAQLADTLKKATPDEIKMYGEIASSLGLDPKQLAPIALESMFQGFDVGGYLADIVGMGDQWRALPFKTRLAYTAAGLGGLVTMVGALAGSKALTGIGMLGAGLGGAYGYGHQMGWFDKLLAAQKGKPPADLPQEGPVDPPRPV